MIVNVGSVSTIVAEILFTEILEFLVLLILYAFKHPILVGECVPIIPILKAKGALTVLVRTSPQGLVI